MPETIVMTFGMYVVSLKSPVGPTACQGCSCFSNSGPSAKPSAGRTNAAVATAPVTWTVPVMKRRRVIVSPSNAPGMPRSAVYLDLASLRSAMTGARNLSAACFAAAPRSAGRRSADRRPVAAKSARRRAQGLGRAGIAVASGRLRGLQRPVGAPADRGRARLPDGFGEVGAALGMGLCAQRDDVGELCHRLEVAERGEAREAERVEVVAGEQDEVGIVVAEEAPGAVVEKVALTYRLYDERDVVGVTGRARAGRGERAEGRVAVEPRGRGEQRLSEQAALLPQRLLHAPQRRVGRGAQSDANAAAAASTVRSTCSGPWASDGNHASNCDGGG